MKDGIEIINTKQLREDLGRVVRRAREGRRFLVLHRSKPAFELGPPSPASQELPPLETDPVFRMAPLGATTDGLSASEHDRVLYAR
jgi:antitoxin (DNA-binding transcriptional repressor) of toxin-antitoxin stability system